LRSEPHERLAGCYRNPYVELVLLARPVADRERGSDGALGVVLVCPRGAEERHHGVADECLDRAAMALDLRSQRRPIAILDRAHVFGVERLRLSSEADQVCKQHGHDLALLPLRRN